MAGAVVQISQFDYNRLKRSIERLDRSATVNDLINEEDAAKLLGISKRWLQNLVSKGEMEGMFNIGAGGNRFYYKSKLVGVEL